MRGPRAQQIDDLGQPIRGIDRPARNPRPGRMLRAHLARISGIFGDREHEVDGAGHDRAARHAVIARPRRALAR